jgi:regulatory protein
MPPSPKPPGPAPDQRALHEAALRHLARFAATEDGLRRVLERRVHRWARAAGAAGDELQPSLAAARAVARAMVEAGAVNDAEFAAARARRLARGGRSRRAVSAHLPAKGVGVGEIAAALTGADDLAAALVYLQRRRIGPFRAAAVPEGRQRDLAALARAGFERDVAERALSTSRADADAMTVALKRG